MRRPLEDVLRSVNRTHLPELLRHTLELDHRIGRTHTTHYPTRHNQSAVDTTPPTPSPYAYRRTNTPLPDLNPSESDCEYRTALELPLQCRVENVRVRLVVRTNADHERDGRLRSTSRLEGLTAEIERCTVETVEWPIGCARP